MIRAKDGPEIRSLEDWKEHGTPKSENHWKKGRRAVETARAWLAVKSPTLPSEISAALSTNWHVVTSKRYAPDESWTKERLGGCKSRRPPYGAAK